MNQGHGWPFYSKRHGDKRKEIKWLNQRFLWQGSPWKRRPEDQRKMSLFMLWLHRGRQSWSNCWDKRLGSSCDSLTRWECLQGSVDALFLLTMETCKKVETREEAMQCQMRIKQALEQGGFIDHPSLVQLGNLHLWNRTRGGDSTSCSLWSQDSH